MPTDATARAQSPLPTARRGTAYLFVLATAAIAGAMALGGLTLVRKAGETRLQDARARRAVVACRSGLELAMAKIDLTMPGRQALAANPTLVGPIGVGGFSVSVTASDPADGLLANNVTDDVRLTAAASFRTVYQSYSVDLDPPTAPVGALSSAMHAGGQLSVAGQVLRSVGSVGADGRMTASSATIDAPAYSGLGCTGSTYGRGTSVIAPPRGLPDGASVVALYASIGTVIPLSSIPLRTLSGCLLGAGSNPYGPTNSQGVYVIDCQGQNLTIKNMRLVGTLVLKNAGAGTSIAAGAVMEPAVTDWPVLIVDGTLSVISDGADLVETTANLNPASTPYRGASNSTLGDRYATEIIGITFVNGDLTVGGNVSFVGSVMAAGNITLQTSSALSVSLGSLGISISLGGGATDEVTVRYVPTATPPPGFCAGNPTVRNGSALRVVR